MTEAIWPGFSPSAARLKNPNAEQRRSRSLVFMKQAKRAFTNWQKTEVVLKGSDNVFCHVRKLPPDKFQMRPFGQENCYHQT